MTERNYHLKLQEMCDCYLETDFKKQMQVMTRGENTDLEEGAIKYLALAIMCAVTEKAGSLSLKKKAGAIKVILQNDEKISLPAPGAELFDKITAVVRDIVHIEDDTGEMPLALGIRSGSLDLWVKVKRKPAKEIVKFKFKVGETA